ncbi:MAG: SAM-dependent methyltransferase [Burkholderiaceae bacterium]|nr:SAM-dependent methyltransferase [Burkholderiaceae bacterium]
MSGALWLIPTSLGAPGQVREVLPSATLACIHRLDYFVVENARSARAFLKAAGTAKPLQSLELVELDEHTPGERIPQLLAPIVGGRDGGLLSEAGAPAVADPGAALVEAAHAAGIVVRPLVGPSAILLALMASGMNGQRFSFAGYVPAQAEARVRRLRELEQRSLREDETILIIETPYRNRALLESALLALAPTTRLMLASELTTPAERIVVDTVAGWRRAPREAPKAPAVFGLQARAAAPTRR